MSRRLSLFLTLSLLLHGAVLTVARAPAGGTGTGPGRALALALVGHGTGEPAPASTYPPQPRPAKAGGSPASAAPQQADRPGSAAPKPAPAKHRGTHEAHRRHHRPAEAATRLGHETKTASHLPPRHRVPARRPAPARAGHGADRARSDQAPAASSTRGATRPEASGPMEPAAVKRHLGKALSKALGQYFHYPALARHRGWQGEVTLQVHIGPDGHIGQSRVLRSSGYPVLDHAALDSLRRVPALPRATAWLHGRGFDIVLPVRYRLVDS